MICFDYITTIINVSHPPFSEVIFLVESSCSVIKKVWISFHDHFCFSIFFFFRLKTKCSDYKHVRVYQLRALFRILKFTRQAEIPLPVSPVAHMSRQIRENQ